MRMILKSLAILLMLTATVSCTPKSDSGQQVCIPGDKNAKDANGKAIEPLEKIEKYLKDKKIITTLVGTLKTKLLGGVGDFGSAARMFNGLVASPGFIMAMQAAFSLFIVIYGLSITAGLVQVTVGDAVIRIVKISVVGIFAMNWLQFYSIVVNFFVSGTEEIMAFFLSSFGTLYFSSPVGNNITSNLFGVSATDFIFQDMDIFISRIFSPHTVALASALMNSGEGNIPTAGFLAIALLFVLWGIIVTVQVYVMSLFALALLFGLAPIFLIFILFKQTSNMFDNWLNQIINFCLQPILVAAFLGMFLGLLAPFMQDLLQYKVCYGGTGVAGQPEGWCFVEANSKTSQCTAFTASSPSPIVPQKLFMFFIFAWMFGANVRFAADMASTLAPSFSADLSKYSGIWKHVNSGGAGSNPVDMLKQFFR